MDRSAGVWCRQGLKRLGGERGCHGQRVSGFGNVCRGGVWRNDAVLQVPEPGAYLPRAVALTALVAELCRGREQFQGQAATIVGRGSDHDS